MYNLQNYGLKHINCEIDWHLISNRKGVTYDTGGADIKAGGHMAGMHRDKGGAAAVASFMLAISKLQPKKIKVVAGMAMVRNSVGSEAYLADEIITSRAGKRVRVGNTDAEGRMAMVDLLCHVKEKCISENFPNPGNDILSNLTIVVFTLLFRLSNFYSLGKFRNLHYCHFDRSCLSGRW